MKRTIKQAVLLSSLVVVSSSVLTGCFNLGFGTTQEYIDMFGNNVDVFKTEDLVATTKDGVSLEKYFYNTQTMNTLNTADTIDIGLYEYFIVQVTGETFTMQEFSISFKCKALGTLVARVYNTTVEPDPASIRSYLSPRDDEGKQIDYSDDVLKDPIAEMKATVRNEQWMDLVVDEWTHDEDKKSSLYTLEKDSYLIVQIVNNLGPGLDLGLTPMSLSAANLLIANYDPDGEADRTLPDGSDDDVDDIDYDDSMDDEFDDRYVA